jgi:hypothetical protein
VYVIEAHRDAVASVFASHWNGEETVAAGKARARSVSSTTGGQNRKPETGNRNQKRKTKPKPETNTEEEIV